MRTIIIISRRLSTIGDRPSSSMDRSSIIVHRRSSIFDHHHRPSTSTMGELSAVGNNRLAFHGDCRADSTHNARWGRAVRCAHRRISRSINGVARGINTGTCGYHFKLTCRHTRIVFAFASYARLARFEPIARAQCVPRVHTTTLAPCF